MTRETITPRDEAHWLDLRRADLTSTKTPALFGMSPYHTTFDLYHAAASGIEVPFKTNERVENGRRMEEYAAQTIGAAYGWEVRPFKDYVRIPGERVGSSFDWVGTRHDGTEVLIEIKAVDYIVHRDSWTEDEAPAHIEVQVQHQLEVADRWDTALIVAFTGIHTWHVIERQRDRETGAAIREAAAEFWAMVDEGREPAPDFGRDADIIALLHRNSGDDLDGMTDDTDMDNLLTRYDVAQQIKRDAEASAKAIKAEIHHRLGDAGGAFTAHWRVKAGWAKDTPGKTITTDMVGETIGARAGYRRADIRRTDK